MNLKKGSAGMIGTFRSKKFRFSLVHLLLIVALALGGCGTNANEPSPAQNTKKIEVEQNPIVTITMADDQEIKLELYPHIAPNTVLNYISLIQKGFYDGLTFHRVIPGFMIQGGDPEGTGGGGPGYSIGGEFSSNGFENELKHEEGVLSMARTNDPNSAGSQFFIMTEKAEHLDGEYAAFGKVIEGMDVVKQVVEVERDGQDKPLEEQKMKKVTIETFGEEYEQPEVIK
jgi:peptidyl-prolyl cis-trans isomerase B (cyclophilin B)